MSVRLALLLGAALSAGAGPPSSFTIQREAREAMHQLWTSSLAARAERVACLAGTIEGDTVRVTAIRPLDGGAGDSLGVGAGASIETCGPPAWQGTVHTHIALYDGQRPYSLFSGSDRGVMLMWGQRWRARGIFCLLFSADQIHCELDGIEGGVIFPSAKY